MMSLRDTSGQDRPLERPRPWRRHRGAALAVLGLAAGVGVVGLYLWKYSGAATSVSREQLSIAAVERGSFVRDVVSDGQVVAAVSPTLYANVAGSVTLKVHAGDSVVKGQELATIDSPDLTARLSQEKATLQALTLEWQRARLDVEHRQLQVHAALGQAEVDHKTAQRELERSRTAYDLGAYSELQTLRAEDALEKAKYALTEAQLNSDSEPALDRFEVDAKKSGLDRQQFLVSDIERQVAALSIRSPVDGQVGQVQVQDRASVPRDAPLLTVVDLSALEVEIKIAESLARDLHAGMDADLSGGGRHWKGIVSGVSPEVVAGQVTTRLRFADKKPAGLRQSQRLSVRTLIERRENVLMVDRGSFLDALGGGFVYLVRDNVAERHPVRLGAASIAKVEILDGLAVGDRIVISGTEAFNNAARVIISH